VSPRIREDPGRNRRWSLHRFGISLTHVAWHHSPPSPPTPQKKERKKNTKIKRRKTPLETKIYNLPLLLGISRPPKIKIANSCLLLSRSVFVHSREMCRTNSVVVEVALTRLKKQRERLNLMHWSISMFCTYQIRLYFYVRKKRT